MSSRGILPERNAASTSATRLFWSSGLTCAQTLPDRMYHVCPVVPSFLYPGEERQCAYELDGVA